MGLNQQVRLLRIVVASPGDVQGERDALPGLIAEINRSVAADRNLRLELSRWETDTYPGFHSDGPQGGIDRILKIEDCDLLLGIFWRRFGTPTKDAGSGTEHEFKLAYQTWVKKGRPQIMVYFNQRAYTPQSEEETDQWGKVLEFRKKFPKEGLWWLYKGKPEFISLVRNHLTQYVRNLTPEALTGKARPRGEQGLDLLAKPQRAPRGNQQGTRIRTTGGGSPESDPESDPIKRVLDSAAAQADQKLWTNLRLSHFSTILPKVTLVESPFHRDVLDTRSIPLNQFVSNFFWCDWDALEWSSQVATSESKTPSILFLTGDAGIGKTASLKILTSRWDKQEPRILPLYAPLTQVLKAHGGALDDYDFGANLDNYLQTQYDDLTAKDLIYTDDDRFAAVVLILDAFDEAALRGGQSRLTILNSIARYCKRRAIAYTRSGFLGDSKLRGIIIASRHRPAYAERQLLGSTTVVTLAGFEQEDVGAWLKTFNSRATVWRQGSPQRPFKELDAQDFSPNIGKYEALGTVVATPLYWYLLACTCAVDPSAASDIVRDLDDPANRAGDSTTVRPATFKILSAFLNSVRKDDFLRAGAFNHGNKKPEKSPISYRNERESVLSALGAMAGESDTREITFSQMIEGHDAKVVQNWAVRALPLEKVEKEGKDVWRFPHLSLVDFILAHRLVHKLDNHANELRAGPGTSNPAGWWNEQTPSIRSVTIEAGRMTMSDRAFDYLEQHLAMLRKERVKPIRDVSEAWSLLNAVIVPKPDRIDQESEYVVAARREDLGLRIANLGLPLLGCCLRVLDMDFEIGEDAEGGAASRYRLRQYLRLASFVLDSEFANRSDVNRLPLNKLHSAKSSMEGVDMKDVVLEYGILSDSELQHAYLLGANLSGIHIDKDCNLQDSNLVGVDLRKATLEKKLRLEGVSLYKADLSKAIMDEVIFALCNMVGAKLQRSELQGATFDQCAMMTVQLQDSNMRRARLKDSILIGASFDNAVLSDAVIVGGVWMNTQFNGTDVKDTLFVEPVGLDPKQARSLKKRGAMFVTRAQYAAMNKDPVYNALQT